MGFTTTVKNSMLDSETVNLCSLHNGDPGASGTSNELAGGSPAYARKAATFNAAGSGERLLNADVTFDVPASTVAYVGFWNSTGPVFKGSVAVTSEVFAAQGQYKITATTTKLTLT
jgi:hypothetical protein